MTNFITGTDAIGNWRDSAFSGKPRRTFCVGIGELARIEVAPKQITLIGGAPGSGKTAFTMQLAIDALRISPKLRCVVCNVEMGPSVLLDRQLARLSGVPLQTIRNRAIQQNHADRIDMALSSLDNLSDRLCFVRPPFDLGNVASTVDAFASLGHGGDTLIICDYIQRIPPPGVQGDKRGSIDIAMNFLRQFADAGAALLVVASVGRTKDSRGRSSYDGDSLDLASFKESGELEFGADDAFILSPQSKKSPGTHLLKHLKSRHGQCQDLPLNFDGSNQSFKPVPGNVVSDTSDPFSTHGGAEWKP